MLFTRPRIWLACCRRPQWLVFVLTAAGGETTLWQGAAIESEGIAPRPWRGGRKSCARAPELIRRYGCAGCHTISGIPGGRRFRSVGPLKDMRHPCVRRRVSPSTHRI